MRRELVIKGRSLTGTSDLTLIAPLKPGLVPSLDAITYKTRTQRLMKTLQGGRVSLHEYALYRPLSDAVERVAAIHSFRVTILEPENTVMLAVTFDGTWESYIRVLWQKVGTLLDIIFCNTQDYVVSHTAGFDAWAGWVRRVQVETHFYFNTHGLTVPDVAYLRDQEATMRRPSGSAEARELAATRQTVVTAEDAAWDASQGNQTSQHAQSETLRQGLQSLAVLFRMTDSYLPGTPDGEILRRAALDLLDEFTPLAIGPKASPDVAKVIRRRFGRQLQWLETPCAGQPELPRPMPVLPEVAATDMHPHIQAGIVNAYEGNTHGCLLLMAVDSPAAGAALLDRLLKQVTTEAKKPAPGGLVTNVAVTYEGLRALGLNEAQLALFPQEFREGMEARASMLGDFRNNHPRRWRLPQRNWAVPEGASAAQVELSAVHVVVQMRIGSPSAEFEATKPAHPLHGAIQAIAQTAGVRLLRVESLRKLAHHANPDQVIEHFGYVDGGSDPVFNRSQAGTKWRNQAHLGDFLLGRDNDADVAEAPRTPQEAERQAWLNDGSFLVVRKLRQYVKRFNAVVEQASSDTQLSANLLKAKMMGRETDGTPLADPKAPGNDFNYDKDREGQLCPIHSHIRRANPRPLDADQVKSGPRLKPGARQPRLLRRSMSYGPPMDPQAPEDDTDRGLFFMAYNASLCEQFEVVQRWIAGGNSAGGLSRHSDPLMGVPDVGEARSFRFEHDGRVHRMALDAAPALNAAPAPLVELSWGLYLFTPSMPALQRLRSAAAAAGAKSAPLPVWSAAEGEHLIQSLLRREHEDLSADKAQARQAWKAALEDPEAQEKFRSAGIWAAIRERHGGVLRTAYGVLVADGALVQQVLCDDARFSVAGYRERMGPSIGEIFLGLDAASGPEYARQSEKVSEAIGLIGVQAAFNLTLQHTQLVLRAFIQPEVDFAVEYRLPRWELNLDAKEVADAVLARLCQAWFGLPANPNGDTLVPGSWRWDWREGQPPIYPAHFTAPSRFIFQPWPNAQVQDWGERVGAALTGALARFIAPYRAAGTVPLTTALNPLNTAAPPEPAPLAAVILRAFPGAAHDALTARTFCGALMGFLPTVDGNFRLSLNEWLRDGTFWSLRAAWADTPGTSAYERALALLRGPLVQAMQLRPSPELVWRRATQTGTRIGSETVQAGDTVVLALVSAAQQALAAGSDDVSTVFGGDRGQAVHPTHACPGYRAGMGVLLGLMAGLITVQDSMRASPAPLSFTFEGRT